MPRPLLSSPSRRDPTAPAQAAGLWTIAAGVPVLVERFDIGPAIVLVPAEQVLLLTADLPLPGLRRRAEALPFAIEDRIAVPLADVHAALGVEVAPQRHLAGIVTDTTMRNWVAALGEAGLGHAMLVPDVLALPVPDANGWSVDLAGARALVRTEDGAGFALPAHQLEAAWQAAGRPAVTAFGQPVPFATTAELSEIALAPLAERLARPALDLRQGRYAGPRKARSPLLRRIVLVAGAGLAAHAAIAAADTIALDRLAAARAEQTRGLIAQVAPTAVIGDDVAASAADLLPQNGAGPSSFLPLLSRVTTALKPLGTTVTMRSIAFDAPNDSMSIEVQAPDMAGLQRVGAAFAAAHVPAQAGAASQDAGVAVGAFLVRGR